MTDQLPNGWLRETPSLAGRRNPRGVPRPIGMLAAIIAIACFILGRQYSGGTLVGNIAGLVIGIMIAVAICIPAARMVRKDRDWFAITGEYIQLRIFYLRMRFWEWRHGWYQ